VKAAETTGIPLDVRIAQTRARLLTQLELLHAEAGGLLTMVRMDAIRTPVGRDVREMAETVLRALQEASELDALRRAQKIDG
jgi:hypothetical protein